jgi:hypothetical protein
VATRKTLGQNAPVDSNGKPVAVHAGIEVNFRLD